MVLHVVSVFNIGFYILLLSLLALQVGVIAVLKDFRSHRAEGSFQRNFLPVIHADRLEEFFGRPVELRRVVFDQVTAHDVAGISQSISN